MIKLTEQEAQHLWSVLYSARKRLRRLRQTKDVAWVVEAVEKQLQLITKKRLSE